MRIHTKPRLPLRREGDRDLLAVEGEILQMKPYNKSNIILAKNLRKNMTEWERKLWYCFLKNYPIRFQRQKAIGNYIADFYCARAGLIIELDGKWHYTTENGAYDIVRQNELEGMGFEILRYSNSEIQYNFKQVCSNIDLITQKLKSEKDRQENENGSL